MAPKLYLTEASPPVRSVLITAAAIGLELEKQEVDILKGENLTPEFIKLNPQHTVPTLVDGDYVLWDSHAINPYLVSKYAKDDSLYPKDIQKRATIDNRLHYNNATIFNSLKSVGKLIFQGADSVTEKATTIMEEVYGLLNTLLERTNYIAGDSLSIADFSVIATISSIEIVVPIDEAKFPKLANWEKEIKKLPCYATSVPGLKKFEIMIMSKLKK